MNRFDRTFARLRAINELGLFPYIFTGYPDRQHCSEILDTLALAGADGIELGVPFSDPLADGVTLQAAGARALAGGAGVEMAFDLVRAFRQRHQVPVALMSYYNPLLAYGLPELVNDAAAAGVDGLIVPDMPFEEAGELHGLCGAAGLHLICMLAPTSTPARIERAAALAGGFIYCVALVGITGARSRLSQELPDFLNRVRTVCRQPLVVGFGISRPEHVRALRGLADGAIVASALADRIAASPDDKLLAAVGQYVGDLKRATLSGSGMGAATG